MARGSAGDRDDALFHDLGETIRAAMARVGVPGVGVGVLNDGREATAGFGVTSVDHPLPVDGETLFQIGSISKTFCGTAAMHLIEQGKLDLEAPLRTYMPDLRLADADAARRVTLRHVFTHTGGWLGDYFGDPGRGDDALAQVVARMVELPQLTPLGEVWSYNNAGFYLAGRAIEIVTGKPYESVIRETILEPLGMTKTFFFAEDAITHRVAVGHTVLPEGPAVVRPWALPRVLGPVGSIVSNARDMLRYARFHLGDGTAPDGRRLLSPASIGRMQLPHAEAGNFADRVGITWMLRDVGGVPTVGHGGSVTGQMANLTLVPSRRFAAVVLTNAHRGAEVHGEANGWALRHYLGLADPTPAPIDTPREVLEGYLGGYDAHLTRLDLRLEGGDLLLDLHRKAGVVPCDPEPPDPPPTRLAFVAPDRAIGLDPPFQGGRGEFLRDRDGRIAWFRFGGRIHRPVA